MRIQICSDLHDEHFPPDARHLADVPVADGVDLLMLPGDIGSGDQSFAVARELADRTGVRVAWLPGNHEFYGRDLPRQMERYRDMASRHEGVIALLDSSTVLDGVRLVGGTLWTDFRLYEGAARLPTAEVAMTIGDRSLSDFQLIKWHGNRFTAQRSAELHAQSRAYLEKTLAEPFDGPTVVMTHHAPHPKSVHATYAAGERVLRSPTRLPDERNSWWINPCFVSDLTPLLDHVTLWAHGHVHNSFDYTVGTCRVIANPRGYPLRNRDRSMVLTSDGRPVFENGEFDSAKVVDLPSRAA